MNLHARLMTPAEKVRKDAEDIARFERDVRVPGSKTVANFFSWLDERRIDILNWLNRDNKNMDPIPYRR